MNFFKKKEFRFCNASCEQEERINDLLIHFAQTVHKYDENDDQSLFVEKLSNEALGKNGNEVISAAFYFIYILTTDYYRLKKYINNVTQDNIDMIKKIKEQKHDDSK